MRKATALLLLVVMCSLGCHRSPSIYGRWQVTGLPNDLRAAKSSLEFYSKQRCEMTFSFPKNNGEIRVFGTFKKKEDTIKFNFTEIKVIGEGYSAELFKQKLTPDMKSKFLNSLNSEAPSKLVWESKDRVRIEEKGANLVLTRD